MIDAIGQIVRDIVDLKYESGNIQDDATLDNMFIWYEWAILHNIIELYYRYGELQGFIEWVRLPRVPVSRDDAVAIVDYSTTGPVIYIANSCVRDDNIRHGTLWRLIHTMREKNKDWDIVCWHDMDGVLHLYENVGKNKEIENATYAL